MLRSIGQPHFGFPSDVFAACLLSGHVGKGGDEYLVSRAGRCPIGELLPADRGDGSVPGHGFNEEKPVAGSIVEYGTGGWHIRRIIGQMQMDQ